MPEPGGAMDSPEQRNTLDVGARRAALLRRSAAMGSTGTLIGRELELAELERMLGGTRLLTLTGAGGCGKTRLARELVERVSSATDGPDCVVVELASVDGAQQLVDVLLRGVGARERFGSSPSQVLLDSLAERRLLLLLDNCEHLVTAVGRLAAPLLDAAPGLRLLATTREPLRLPGERVFQLGPLSVPEGGDIGAVVRSDAGRLFVDHAARNDPGFELTPAAAQAVARICRELDGLPLALTLAAARIDALSATEIADGLARRGRLSESIAEDAVPQHRSVRASLDWSYQLLDERERALLRALAVFAGGFTAGAAHAVSTVAPSETAVRGLLEALEAKGLIVSLPGEDRRWTLLQTVAEYAAEQLTAEGDHEQVADQHLVCFRAYAVEADTLLLLHANGHELIDQEAPNVRLAMARAIERDPPAALDIAASLMRHWILAEHFEEARAASGAVLAASGRDADVAARAVVHCGAGLLGMLGEDYEGAIANMRSGLDLLQDVPGATAQALCLQLSAMVLIQTGVDLEQGFAYAERAVELQRGSGDPLGLAYALVNLAMAGATCERFDTARTAYEEFMNVPLAWPHARLCTWAELALAWTEVMVGSPTVALAHAEQALALEGDWPSMTHFQAVGFRIHALARLGRRDEALGEGERALSRAKESKALQAIPAIELALMVAEFLDGQLDAAAIRARALLRMPNLHTLALAHEVLARIALARGEVHGVEMEARELDAVAGRLDSARQHALAQFIEGCAAARAGEPDRARELLHFALATHAELGLEREAADVLEELAQLAAQGGDAARAARLAAASAAARARLGCAPPPETQQRLAAARACLSGHTQRTAWEAGWAEGEMLALADAIAYARRGRGARARAPFGWGSLTPVEFDVAQLAASGISNPQIAAQLFIARGTVKMHLSSVYLKLGVANRVELAATMANAALDQPAARAMRTAQANAAAERAPAAPAAPHARTRDFSAPAHHR